MALLRKLFARKAMDGLSRVSERVFVFNSCLSTETLDEDARRDYLTSTIIQLQCCHPHASLMVLNLTGDKRTDDDSVGVDSLLRRGGAATAVVAHYPSRYAGCPTLPLSKIHAFLGSCVDWLVSDRQRNILLMHCDDAAAWPALAFAVASLLVYIEEPAPEERTLDAVYGRAPMELLRAAASALNPRPSHLRYLRYVTRLRARGSLMGMRQEPFVLDCLILRAVPDFDGDGGCRPVVRVHGREPRARIDAPPEVLFSTPRIKQQFKRYNQAESAVIKANIERQIQGDVVIECIHVGEEGHEEIMFRVMFNTCFLQSNMVVFNMEDIDLPWNCSSEKFQEDFNIEVFFSEVEELSEIYEIYDESELASIENADEFYDFDEFVIDSDFLDPKDHQWHVETSQQDGDQDPGINPEEVETEASGTASSNSSDEKETISTDDDARFMHGADLTRESKDTSLEKARYLLEVVGNSATQQVVTTTKDLNKEMPTNCQENRSVPQGVMHQGAETSIQEGDQGVKNSATEVNHSSVAGYGTLNPQSMRKTRQKQGAIIPPVPIIKKKMRKPDIGSDDQMPAIGKVLVASQKGALVATSSSKNRTSQAKTTPSPHKQYGTADRLKQAAAQARTASNLSKEHLKHSSHQATGDPAAQKGCADDTTTEIKQAAYTLQTPLSSPPGPPSQGLNQEDSKGIFSPLETTKKSTTRSPSVKPITRRQPKQEATMAPAAEAPRRTIVLKKSLSSPAISETLTTASSEKSSMTSLHGVKTTHPSSALPVTASSSPRARRYGVPSPSSPRRSLLVSSEVVTAVRAAQPDTQQGISAPVRLPRRASFGELSPSLGSARASDARSLSPRASRVTQNHPAGVKGSGRSLSPLSPRLSGAQQSPKTTAAVTITSFKDSNTSGAAPARPTRLSS